MIRIISIFALIISLTNCMPAPSGNGQPGAVATGMLKTRDYIVTMYVTQSDTLYSVRTLDGTVLEEDIPLDSMIALFPELEYLKDNDNISWAGLDGVSPAPDSMRRDP